MTHLEKKHQLATRWTHWVNFPVLFVMIWSGLLIYWANPVYRIGLGSVTLFHFFPDWVYNLFQLKQKLALGMAVHFLFMWLFAVNGLFYVIYTMASGHWREMFPGRHALRDAYYVTLHDLGLRKELPPQGKYNAGQQIAYTGILVMGIGSLLTGLAIYRPIQTSWLTTMLGGYEAARWEHFWLTMGYLGFFVIHVGQVILAGWNNFRSIVTGYEVVQAQAQAKAVHGD